MTTLAIPRKHLQVAAMFSAKMDIRSYLNGVLVEATDRYTRLVATDGHMLAIINLGVIVEPFRAIIPNDAVDLALRLAPRIVTSGPGKGRAADIVLTTAPFSLSVGKLSVGFAPIDGDFPKYAQTVPAKCSGTPCYVNPHFFMRFVKAAEVYKGKGRSYYPTLEQNGDGAAIVHGIHDDCLGLIMPMRQDARGKGQPKWFTEQEIAK